MFAAVVTAFGEPPSYREIPGPVALAPDEVVVDVVAAGLHPRLRSQADGSHYMSSGVLPLVPGIDGVGRAPDGSSKSVPSPALRPSSRRRRCAPHACRSSEAARAQCPRPTC